MSDLDYRFTAPDGTEYKVAQRGQGSLQLCRFSQADRWFNGVSLNCYGEALLAELARLATQKAENLPDGSREFEHGGKRWNIGVEGQGAFIASETRDGWRMTNFENPMAPPYYVIAREFAALGREQGRAEAFSEVAAMDEEIAAKSSANEAALADLAARIAELEAKLSDEKWKSDGIHADCKQARRVAHAAECLVEILKGDIRDLEQAERESRAEVADLLGRLEAQKARADANDRAANADAAMAAKEMVKALAEIDRQKARADGAEFLSEREVQGYEPHVRLYVRRGDRIYILAENRGHYDPRTGAELSPPNREWVQLPPLPPIEPAKAGAEECEPDPPGMVRHDWHTHRGHVSCERCGAPFSEGLKDHACGAQP